MAYKLYTWDPTTTATPGDLYTADEWNKDQDFETYPALLDQVTQAVGKAISFEAMSAALHKWSSLSQEPYTPYFHRTCGGLAFKKKGTPWIVGDYISASDILWEHNPHPIDGQYADCEVCGKQVNVAFDLIPGKTYTPGT